MFKSVGWTWNPIPGCTHGCTYCWAESLMKRWGKSFEPQLREHFFKDKMPNDGTWIFVGSMGDAFCDGVPDEWINKLLDFIESCEADNKFLLQTKNPERFIGFEHRLEKIRDKVILGTTLETTEETPWSEAPSTFMRASCLTYMKINKFKTFLSLEPISQFDLVEMLIWINDIDPEAVEIGLENYGDHTIRPSNDSLFSLIYTLRERGYTVILKENLDYLYPSLDRTKMEEE